MKKRDGVKDGGPGGNGLSGFVKFHNTETLRIIYIVTEHGSSLACLGIVYGRL